MVPLHWHDWFRDLAGVSGVCGHERGYSVVGVVYPCGGPELAAVGIRGAGCMQRAHSLGSGDASGEVGDGMVVLLSVPPVGLHFGGFQTFLQFILGVRGGGTWSSMARQYLRALQRTVSFRNPSDYLPWISLSIDFDV